MSDLQVIDAHTHLMRSDDHGRELWSYFLGRGPGTGFAAEPQCYATVDEVQALMSATSVVHTNFLNFTWSGKYYAHGLYTLPDDPRRRAEAERELRARVVQRVRDNNEWAVSVVRDHRNLSFFCGVDPVLMDEATLLAEVEDKTRRGALGVKIVPRDLNIRGDDRRLWPVYDFCQTREIPLLSETSGRPGAPGRPVYFGTALKEFPRLKLICAHMGHNPEFGKGADLEVIELARAYAGVHADVSLRFPEVANGHISPEAMVAHLRRIGADRLMYGSNFPFVELLHPDPPRAGAPHPRPQITQSRASLEVLKTLPLTDREREQIASENFQRVTGLRV
jgi:predicted TIM-barrel fold metal-dependent hydrolase